MFALFSLKNGENTTDWFTFANDWDGWFKADADGKAGGVFIAPNCNKSLNNRDNIWDVLDGINATTANWLSNREPLAGGNISNWEILTQSRIDHNTNPLQYTIENDLISGQLKTYFNAPTINKTSCMFENTFDTQSGNDYIFIFLSDNGKIQLSQFDIDVSCQVCFFH